MLRRNGPVVKSVESVLRLEGSLWWERFVKEVGLEAGMNVKCGLVYLVSCFLSPMSKNSDLEELRVRRLAVTQEEI